MTPPRATPPLDTTLTNNHSLDNGQRWGSAPATAPIRVRGVRERYALTGPNTQYRRRAVRRDFESLPTGPSGADDLPRAATTCRHRHAQPSADGPWPAR